MADLRALAERFVSLSSEIESVRHAMLACLSNGVDHDEASAPGQPAAAKAQPNGVDLHPPPRQAKVRPKAIRYQVNERIVERKLIAAMRAAPGASVIMLARSIGGNRSSVGEQLRKLALAGAIEKASDGHWRIAGERPREDESRPMQASP